MTEHTASSTFAMEVQNFLNSANNTATSALSSFLDQVKHIPSSANLNEAERLLKYANIIEEEIREFSRVAEKYSERAVSTNDPARAEIWQRTSDWLTDRANERVTMSNEAWLRSIETRLQGNLGKVFGPIGDSLSLLEGGTAAYNGDWDRVGEISAGIIGGIVGVAAAAAIFSSAAALIAGSVVLGVVGSKLGGWFGESIAIPWGRDKLDGVISRVQDYFGQAGTQASPIILDLDGSGINTVGFDSDIYFDHNGNGFAQLTGWVGTNDGLLVLDRNGNGIIDNGAELFGNNTVLTNGMTAVNGFAALAEHDSNGDGVVDADDTIWAELRVWRDLSQDGVTREGELITLDELGIVSINLDYANSSYVDEHGNAHKQVGSFTWSNGAEGIATDVWFASDNARTRTIDLIDIPENIAALPDLQAFGNVHSLHQAMARDESGKIQALVEQFMAETTRTPRIELMTSIMYEWVGTSDLDASSRGNFIDARKVIVLESFLGEPFIQGGSQNPRQQAARLLEQAFSELTQSMYKELMAQTHFKPYLDSIEMVFSEDGITLDFTATDALFAEYRAENKLIALDELIEFNQLMGKNLVPLGWTGTNLLLGWLQEDFGMGSLPEGFESDFVIYGSGTLHGTDGDSILIGDESNNRIYGQGGNNTLIAGDGNNHLYGGSGDNLFIMGGGTDRLYSQNTSSNDIYRFGRGNGSNTIYEYGGSDVIELGQNIAEEHVTVRRNGANLVLTLDTGESVTVNGMFQSSTGTLNENRAVELIRFADGTEWDIDRIRTEALKPAVGGETIYGFDTDDTLQGGDGNDRLYGGGGNNTLIAGSGNNYLYGGAGNDTLIGGEGNDRIYGQGGNNTLIAGDGNNHLYGGSGDNLFIMGGGTDRLYSQNTSSNDIYRFGRGNGSNTIYEYGGSDVIELGQDIAEEHVTVRRNGANLVLTLDTGESITVNGMFQSSTGTLNENRAVELIRFADGNEWDIDRIRTEALKPAVGGETIYGFDTDDTLQGGDGNDRLYGGGGNNTLIAGSGNNYLYGGAGNDTLIGGEGSDRLYGGAGDDVLIAGIGDRLYGEDGNDILIAARDSHLYGGRGADQYHFQGDYHNSRIHSVSGAPNMEDTAHFNDASAQDLWFRRSGNDLLIDVIGTENQVRFIGWYRNADHRVGEIHAGDMVASANQIDQLVLAMAEFAPEGGGIHTELTDDMRNALAPTLAASWSAAA